MMTMIRETRRGACRGLLSAKLWLDQNWYKRPVERACAALVAILLFILLSGCEVPFKGATWGK